MIAWSAAAVAFAGNQDTVEAAAKDGADVVITCESLGTVMDALKGLADQLPSDKEQEALGIFEQATGAFAPEQPFTLAMWNKSVGASLKDADYYLEFTFGTSLDEVGVANAIAQDGGETVQVGDAGVRVGDKYLVSVQAGTARVREATGRPRGTPSDASLGRALPSTGCLVYMEMPAESDFPGGTIAFHVPFETPRSVRFVVRPNGEPIPRGAFAPAGAHAPVRTLAAPGALVWVGVNLAELDPAQLELKKEEARKFARLQRRLPADGLTIAMFPSENPFMSPLPAMAIDLPLAADWSAAATARKARALIRKVADGVTFDKQSAGSFIVHPREASGLFATDVHVLASEGGIRLATSPQLLDDMSTPGGQPWVDDAHREQVLYLRFRPSLLPMLQAPEGTELAFGLGVVDGLIVGDIALTGPTEELFAWSQRLATMIPKKDAEAAPQ